MSAGDLASIIIAATAVVALVIGGVAWFYKRGAEERELTLTLRDNTRATDGLTTRLDAFMERTQARQDSLDARVTGVDTRLTVAEHDISDLRNREVGRAQ